MMRIGLLCLLVITVLHGQPAGSPNNASLAANSCETIQADLRLGDLEHASQMAGSLAMMTARFNPAKQVAASETGSEADPKEAAARACAQIADAYAANNPAAAQQVAANLQHALAQAAAALPAARQAKFARMEAAVSHLGGLERFYRLVALAKAAFDAGEFDKAAAYGHELIETAAQYPTNWNYGNAVYFGNWVLGRVALRQGDASEAGQFLLRAATTTGSPQLNSFGPNMMLAQELLEKGQTAVVLQYFDLCAKFWKMDRGNLDAWAATIKAGGMPNFGPNLLY